MDTNNFRRWYDRKLKITDELVDRGGEGTEVDAEILLCCATSALASYAWSGKGIDRQRFVEFLVQFAPKSSAVQKISIGLLSSKLEDKGDNSSALTLKRQFLPANPALVIDGDLDQFDQIITTILPDLPLAEVRESSYAAAICIDLRCALIHEYQLSPHISSWGVSNRTDIPTYVNLRVPPDLAD